MLLVQGWYLEVLTCFLHHLVHGLIISYELTHLPQSFLCPGMHLAFQKGVSDSCLADSAHLMLSSD
jgi:hypothetical protein